MSDYILCGGCSFTANDYDFPVWPELVGNHYGVSFVNVAQSGQGNDFIFDRFIDYILIRKNKPKHILFAMTEFHRFYPQWGPDNFKTFGNNEQQDYDYYYEHAKENNYRPLKKEGYELRKYIIELALQNYIDTRLIIGYNLKLLVRLIDTCELLDIPITIGLAFGPGQYSINVRYKSDNGIYKSQQLEGFDYSEYLFRSKNIKLKDELIVDEKNFLKQFLKNPYFKKIDQDPKYYSKIIGWPFIEAFGGHTLTNWKDQQYEISRTDFHPNAKGHKWMAEHFIKHIGSTL